MKSVLQCLLFVIIFSNVSYASNFVDIEDSWAKEQIEDAVLDDIVNGYEDNTFRPQNDVTLTEYLKIIINTGKIKMSNYYTNTWPDDIIKTAIDNELIYRNEYTDYNKKLTRNEVARITSRFVNINDTKKVKNIFRDMEEEYKEDILKLVSLKVINGYEDKTYRGSNNVTRAEAVVIATRAKDAIRKNTINKTYDLQIKSNYTNNGEDKSRESSYSYKWYEIVNRKIIYNSKDSLAPYENFEASNSIDSKKAIKIIEGLINEDGYTAVEYRKNYTMPNELSIYYAENEQRADNRTHDLEISFYENDGYSLKDMLGLASFSNKCYMRIDILKLWRNYSEFKRGNYIDEYEFARFKKALKEAFGEKTGEEISNYILQKIEYKFTHLNQIELEIEEKRFGKIVVYYYQKDNESTKFFISHF